jgi:hypothetical protein
MLSKAVSPMSTHRIATFQAIHHTLRYNVNLGVLAPSAPPDHLAPMRALDWLGIMSSSAYRMVYTAYHLWCCTHHPNQGHIVSLPVRRSHPPHAGTTRRPLQRGAAGHARPGTQSYATSNTGSTRLGGRTTGAPCSAVTSGINCSASACRACPTCCTRCGLRSSDREPKAQVGGYAPPNVHLLATQSARCNRWECCETCPLRRLRAVRRQHLPGWYMFGCSAGQDSVYSRTWSGASSFFGGGCMAHERDVMRAGGKRAA